MVSSLRLMGLVVCVLLLGGCTSFVGLSGNPLIGCWEGQRSGDVIILTFESDMMSVKDSEGYLTNPQPYDVQGQSFVIAERPNDNVDFEFSNGGNTLTIWSSGTDDRVSFTKTTCSEEIDDKWIDVEEYLPKKCEFPVQLPCVGPGYVNPVENTITFALTNYVGDTIKLTDSGVAVGGDCRDASSIVFGDVSGGAGGDTAEKEVQNGEMVKVTITCGNPIAEGSFTSEILLQYLNTATGIIHTVTGRIQATVN